MEKSWSKQCAVPGCKDYRKTAAAGVPFHKFPRDDKVKREWIVKIRNGNLGVHLSWDTLKHYRVCGKHFTHEDYAEDMKHRFNSPAPVQTITRAAPHGGRERVPLHRKHATIRKARSRSLREEGTIT